MFPLTTVWEIMLNNAAYPPTHHEYKNCGVERERAEAEAEAL